MAIEWTDEATLVIEPDLTGGSAFGQDYFSNIPEHHSIYDVMARMEWIGAADSPYPGGRRIGGGSLTRGEIARWVARNVPRLPTRIDEFLVDRQRKPRQFDGHYKTVEAYDLLLALEGLPQLLKTFQRELKASGVDFASFERIILDSAERVRNLWQDPHAGPRMPFLDVPRYHWAFEATAELKAAGLLRGYPSGNFSNFLALTVRTPKTPNAAVTSLSRRDSIIQRRV